MQTSRGSRSGILSKSEQLDRCGFIFVMAELGTVVLHALVLCRDDEFSF
jgi:hypothetical protein